jgi:hypothetical protein
VHLTFLSEEFGEERSPTLTGASCPSSPDQRPHFASRCNLFIYSKFWVATLGSARNSHLYYYYYLYYL